ncbi:Ig-like domain-containing protein [Psychrobacillus sp. BM2]|uniref:Ig-like domain-containing protein n=1 Tax=Psychrobacillus sp. BM2 TaxID=3400421 RepID=UPI003B01A388
MANQPTKYKKFLAGAASATLVATAIVPTALAADATTAATDFSDVAASHTHYAAIMQAVERGLFNGYTDGTFKPENTIDRKGVVKSLANYVVSQSDYKTYEEYITANKLVEKVTPFNDVPATHGDAELFNASLIVKDSGIFTGSNNNLMPTNNITRQQMAKVLVNGFGLKDLAGVESKVTDNAKAQAEYVNFINILSENGVTDQTAFNPTGNLKRGQMASFLNRSYDSAHKVVAPETATKVVSVSATNLKEVVVAFDGSVDKSTASEVVNYSISGTNSPEVDSVLVAEDAKSVTLTLKGELVNQNEYKLALNNIKAGDKVLNEKDLAFKPLDNTVPTVSSVEALGNKTIRVAFSEPVKPAQTAQFTVDGKVVVGSIQTTGKTAIIKLSSSLTDGEHTLTAEGISDYNNFKVVKADTKFNVVEDKTAPVVASVVSASFEKVVLKFSEPVEQVFASNVYWMQGAAKKQASSVKALSDDTFEFTFVGDNKLVYTTDLFVTNVKDYSGNVIDKDTKVQVSPVIDQTRPEVLSSAFVKDSDNKKVVIKFSKTLDQDSAKKASNYVIKDKDGKTQLISSTVDASKDKEVTITLLNSLKDNSEYTLTVNGVSDNTTLKNVILPYTTTLSVKDVTSPTLVSVTRLNNTQLYVQYSEAMSTSGDGSVVDSSKYTVTNTAENKTLTPASFNVTGDAKGVIINFNDTLPAFANLTLKAQLVKDLAGNYLANLTATQPVIDKTATTVDTVTAVATDKVEVTFTKALQSLNQGDFLVEGNEIAYSELSADGKTATFTLKTDLREDVKNAAGTGLLKLTVAGTPSSVDILGEKIGTIAAQDITDEISATVKAIASNDTSGQKIKITFNEGIKIGSLNEVKTDFVIKDNEGKALSVTAAAVSGAGNEELVLTLNKPVIAATVSVKDSRFITDLATDANSIADVDARTVELGGDNLAPALSAVGATVAPAATDAATLAFTSDEAGTYYYLVYADAAAAPTVDQVIAQGTAVTKGTGAALAAANSVAVSGLTTGTSYKAYVVVVDAKGNKSALGTATTFATN